MRIIDAQVHIWDAIPERVRAKHADERPQFTYQDLLGVMDQAGVAAAILVPRSFDGARNDYALEAARACPGRLAVMGRVPRDEAAGKPLLQRWRDQPGMLGARLTFHRDADRAFLTDGSMDWFWPEAERCGIPVMVHAPERLPELARIASRHPDLAILLDHMGFARANIDAEVEPAIQRLLELADVPNISVKISASPCYSTQRYPHSNLRAPIRRVLQAFGSARCCWGSDLTRLPGGATAQAYRECVTMFTEADDFLTPRELEDVMGASLAACLGWP